MAVTIVATAGGATANSYCTLAQANTYHEERLHIDDWTNASTSKKNSALVWATRILDEVMNWYGYKNSSVQALRWPRSSIYDQDGYPVTSSAIPIFLREATAEFARHLIIEDRTLETNRDTIGYKKMEIGDLKLEIDPDPTAKKITVPPSVWSMVRPYCTRIGRSRTLVRM